MEKSPQEIRRMFASIAARYDLLNRILSLWLDAAWRRRAVGELRLRPGELVLDLCSGTGDLADQVLRDGGSVVASDFCHEMLCAIPAKAPRARRVEADALRLPFADGRFDAVIIGFGLRNLADPVAGLREMRRVLRPGGRLVILEFSLPTGRVFRALYHLYLGKILPWAGDLLSRRRGPYRYLARSIVAFPDQPTLAGHLRDAGFTDARWIDLSRGIVALHLGTRSA
jgi:demethylmenaquinone methyltransferase/2-methoxy-6-polyprenyl-1,4-benzoquinol methylase